MTTVGTDELEGHEKITWRSSGSSTNHEGCMELFDQNPGVSKYQLLENNCGGGLLPSCPACGGSWEQMVGAPVIKDSGQHGPLR